MTKKTPPSEIWSSITEWIKYIEWYLPSSIKPTAETIRNQINFLIGNNSQNEQILFAANHILQSESYEELLRNIEATLNSLWIQRVYFDFPQNEIGAHFYNEKINAFINQLYLYSQTSKKIRFNNDLAERKNLLDISLKSKAIYLPLRAFHYKTISEFTQKHPDIPFDSDINIKEWKNGEIVYVQQDTIGVLTLQFKQSTSLWVNKTIDSLMEAILFSIQNLWKIHHLTEKAHKDSLTGLFNRWFLDKEIDSFKLLKTPLAFFAFDANGFKSINDGYGHDAWDKAIQAFAGKLQDIVDEYNINNFHHSVEAIAARNGGDEFQLIFPFCWIEYAEVLAKKCIREIESLIIPYWNTQLKLGTCIWISIWDWVSDMNFAQIADDALINRKKVKNDPNQPQFLIREI